MFDIGFYELALIGVLALLVLGPKRLPEAARTAGRWVGKLRAFVANVKQDIDREIEGGELTELKRLKEELSQARTLIEESSNSIHQQVDQMADNANKGVKGLDSPTLANKKKVRPKKKTARKKLAGSKKAVKKKTAKKKVVKKKSRKRKA